MFADLPSDGVCHVIDDGPVPAEYPCRCTDCRCAAQVEVELIVNRANQIMADLMGPQQNIKQAPMRRRRRRN